jgi:hypothetical protein
MRSSPTRKKVLIAHEMAEKIGFPTHLDAKSVVSTIGWRDRVLRKWISRHHWSDRLRLAPIRESSRRQENLILHSGQSIARIELKATCNYFSRSA